MKAHAILFIACFMSLSMVAQEKPVKIVFDVTSSDNSVHGSTIRHVKAMSEAYPKSQFEVVMYSGSLNMALKNKSSVEQDMAELAAMDNISFVMCEGTLKRHKIDKSELIDGVKTVPDGILEIVNKQKKGWGYIKESK